LKKLFGAEQGDWPRFDLIFLGLGEDGHTASLFPGTAALDATESWVVAVYVEKLQSHRLTLTRPVIRAAAQVSFLVYGPSKAEIVREIFVSDRALDSYPAATVAPRAGHLTWLIDRDAARELPPEITGKAGVAE
jgi:6-phosphogluconolactonase